MSSTYSLIFKLFILKSKGRECLCTQHIFFLVIWCQAYGKGLLGEREREREREGERNRERERAIYKYIFL